MTDYHLPPQIGGQPWEPSTTALATVLDALVDAGRQRAERLQPTEIADILGEVSTSWLDATTPERGVAEVELAQSTGYSRQNVAAALDDMFTALRRPELARLLAVEEPDLPATRPELVLHIPAGTVFPPAVVGPLCSLLLGGSCLVRPPHRIATLAARWAASVAARSPELARRIAVLPWPREQEELTRAALARATTAVLHGDDASLARIAELTPAATHLVRHGHRVAAAVVGGSVLDQAPATVARDLARDVALYDQHGCLSPHTVLVIEDGVVDAARFAELLAVELTHLTSTMPPGRVHPPGFRSLLATRELECYARDGRVLGGIDAGWVIFCSRAGGFEFAPGERVVFVMGVDSPALAAAVLRPVRPLLQAVGLAIDDDTRLALGPALGQSTGLERTGQDTTTIRLCPVGAMQRPPPTWPADGLRPMVSQCPVTMPE